MDRVSASVSTSPHAARPVSRVIFDSSSSVGKSESESPKSVGAPELALVDLGSSTVDTNVSSPARRVVVTPDQERFKKGFRDCLTSDQSDYGMKSMAEVYVENWMSKGSVQVQLWLSEVYLENQHDHDTLMALLKVMMHVDPVEFAPINRMIALASLSDSSLEVRECAVRCYEYWETPEFYVDLINRPLEPAWLEDYKNSFLN